MKGAAEVPRVNAAARAAVIAEYLKALKLPAFATEYQGLVRQARDGGWDYEDFLRELLEVELHFREERTAKRRLKEARFSRISKPSTNSTGRRCRASRSRRSWSWRAAST